MKRLSASSFARRLFKSNSDHTPSQGSKENLEKPPMITANNFDTQSPNGNMENTGSYEAINVIINHDFSEGLHLWNANCCNAFVVPAGSGYHNGNAQDVGCSYAVVTNRKECWQGLEQDITRRVTTGCVYTVSACVGVSGTFHGSTEVQATLRVVYENSETSYLFISRKSVTKEGWQMLEGSFSLSTMPNQVVFYLEGPSPGSDLLIKSVVVACPSCTNCTSSRPASSGTNCEKIIVNPNFDDNLRNWSGRGCKVVLHDCIADVNVNPTSGRYFASATDRTQCWNGIQQDITGRVKRKVAYEMTAVVRLYGHNANSADIRGTLWVQAADNREQYIGIAKVQATDKDWVQLHGKFLLNDSPSKAVIFLEGPPPGTDILLNSLYVNRAAKPPPPSPLTVENAVFGVNIITNTQLNYGTNGWFPLGNCTMSVQAGSPHIIPPMAMDSLGARENLSGRYILVSNRTQTWMGPAQVITDKVKLFLTYQVSAWVKIGQASGPQNVSVALGVDDQWVNGGQVEVSGDKWHEIGGSFRIEKQAAKVMVYVQGPAAGVDLMVAGLQVFPVDRRARFNHLKRQTEKVRKRDVILKLSGSNPGSLHGTFVRVSQKQNSFPFGSCICRTNMDNEDFNSFFVKNFNWAVFGNELKWYCTEPHEQGKFNYRDADELLDFCTRNNIQVRGHCIFWEVESTVQEWIRSLNNNDLMTALENRLSGLLTRYKGKFKHYDVNNEMMHGSYYQHRLGREIWSNMFKKAHQLDPSAILFVNDYHVEDGCDAQSSPEKYIEHILDLQEQGAPVGGIGIQGHIDCPVGPIICSALDKLSILGLPIWFTEVDVSSINEHVRAYDLEVMLREAFAHPAVEGIILWGFWELFMSRENSHLVNAEGELNEAGKRYLALKQEWLSHTQGHINDQDQFNFHGFHGSYEVEIVTASKKITKVFVVDKGDDALVIPIDVSYYSTDCNLYL